MSIYAIGDLHLGKCIGKTMDIFGDEWMDHDEQIKKNWIETVTENDTVLIPGDISWALTLDEARQDLDFVASLPGKKIIVKGNHDYWWHSTNHLNTLYKDMSFIKTTHVFCEDVIICGAKGYFLNNDEYSEHDITLHQRELVRLGASLSVAKKHPEKNIIVILHYPPFAGNMIDNDFLALISKYNVVKVVYGHLHRAKKERPIDGYMLVSADYIRFKPRLIKL